MYNNNITLYSFNDTQFYKSSYGLSYAKKKDIEYESPLKEFLKKVSILENDILLSRHISYNHKGKKKGSPTFGKLNYDTLSKIWKLNNNLFEVLKSKRKPYFDVEFPANRNIERVKIFTSIRKCIFYVFNKLGHKITLDDLFISFGLGKFDNPRDIWYNLPKYSYHIIINKNIYFESVDDIKLFKKYLNFIISTEFKDIIIDNKTAIDLCVYGINQQIKLPFNSKIKDDAIIQIPSNKNYQLKDYLISYGIDDNYTKIDVSICNNNFEERIDKIKKDNNLKIINYKNKDILLDYYEYVKNKNYKIKLTDEPSTKINYLVDSIYNDSDIPYDIYFQIGSAIKRVEGDKGISLFQKWCSKSSKNDSNYNSIQYSNYSINTRGYTTLLCLACFCNDDLNNYVNTPYLQLFSTDDLNKVVPIININKRYLPFTNDFRHTQNKSFRYLDPANHSFYYKNTYDKDKILNPILTHDNIFIKSPMGTGKSYTLHSIFNTTGFDENNYFKGFEFKKVVYMSSRQAFSCSMANEFEDDGFINYLDKEHFTGKEERVIISLESINKYQYDSCDLLVIDESESIFNIFSSDTLKKNNFRDNLVKFKNLIKNSKKVLIMDAFLSNRSICAIQYLRHINNDNTIYYNNNYKYNTRYALELSQESMITDIINKLKDGKRCVLCSGSKNFGSKLIQNVKKLGFEYIFYNDKNPLPNNTNVNKEWKDIKLLVYSPTITCGISYDNPTHKFDNLYIYAVNINSTHFRDIIQAHKRVREFNDNTIRFCINDAYNGFNYEKTPIDRKIIKDTITKYRKVLFKDDIPSIQNDEQLKDWVLDINCFNILEENIHSIFLSKVCQKFFELENIEIKEPEKNVIDLNLEDRPTEDWEYNNIKTISTLDYSYLQIKMDKGVRLDDDEYKSYHKYIFNKRLKNNVSNKDLLFNEWFSEDFRKYIQNVKDLKRMVYIKFNEYKKQLLETNANFLEVYNKKLLVIEHLYENLKKVGVLENDKLNLNKTFTTKDFDDLVEKYKDYNTYSFNQLFLEGYYYSKNKKGEIKKKTTRTIKSLLNDNLTSLYQYEIESVGNYKQNGRRITEYKIVPINNYDLISNFKDDWKELTKYSKYNLD